MNKKFIQTKSDAVLLCILIVILIILTIYSILTDNATRLVRRCVSEMGYADLAETITLEKTEVEGVYRASAAVVDKATGIAVEQWRIGWAHGFSTIDHQIAEPYPPMEEKHRVTFEIGETRYQKLEQAAQAEGKSVEDYLASIPWLDVSMIAA